MTPALIIGGIPFYDAPSDIEGSPYWVDLWTAEINGRKIGLQVKPSSYKSPNLSIYMGRARSSEEQGHINFCKDFGGKVFIVTPTNGLVSSDIESQIIAERDRLMALPPI